MLWISEITQYFQKCFTDYETDTWALQKMWNAIGDFHTTWSSLFRWKMGCIKKGQNIKYHWHFATVFFFIFHHVFGKIMGYSLKITDIIEQNHFKGNVSQFCIYHICYINSNALLITTRFFLTNESSKSVQQII